jgi:glycosyltransferase involved in cell wall biosynthesis
MKKNTIAIFIPSYHVGGAEKVLISLANSFLAHFDEVHMLSNTTIGPLKEQLDPSVKCINFGNSTYIRILFKLSSYFDTYKPDAVLTSIYATGLVAIAARLISRHQPVLLIGAHNSFSAKLSSPDNIKDKYLLRPLSRLLFYRAEAIVSVSKGVSDDLSTSLDLPAEKLHVIYNPVVTRDLLCKAMEPLKHRWLGDQKSNYKTILCVGRLIEQKGFDLLLDAFSRLKNREEYRLVIVGDGPLAVPLKTHTQVLGIEELVDFTGYDLNPYRYMSHADAFILPSRWEGLPTVIIEAMACGCQIIATDCQYGPKEILEEGKYGTLVHVGDTQALTNAIQNLFSNKLIHINKKELKHRANHFNDVNACKEYVRLIKKLLQK